MVSRRVSAVSGRCLRLARRTMKAPRAACEPRPSRRLLAQAPQDEGIKLVMTQWRYSAPGPELPDRSAPLSFQKCHLHACLAIPIILENAARSSERVLSCKTGGCAMEDIEGRVISKVMWRLIPFLIVCYFVAYLDRVNVGFAKLHMNQALGLSEAAFGLGAGLFFVGYFLFEVPSNIFLEKVGARVWIARIMITWGIVSAAFAFIPSISGATGVPNAGVF